MTKQNNSGLIESRDLAFRLIDDAHAYKGAAPQAMAFTLRTLHQDYVTQGGMRIPGKNGEGSQMMPVPTWDALNKGGEAKTLFVQAAAFSLGVRYTGAVKDEPFKAKASRQTANNTEKRHHGLIASTIPFAAALEARAIPMDHYDMVNINGKKLPAWRVPVRSIVAKEWTLLGDDAAHPESLRALDGKSILAMSKNDKGEWRPVQNAVASVDQFKRATFGDKAKKVKGADNPTPAPVMLDNGKEVPMDFVRLVRAAGSLIAEITDNGAAMVKLSDFDEETRHALAALNIFYHEAAQAAKQGG